MAAEKEGAACKTNVTLKKTNEESIQRLMAERLKLVPVFLTELLGSLGGFQRVGLAGHRPLYHLLTTTNSSTVTAATIVIVFFFLPME